MRIITLIIFVASTFLSSAAHAAGTISVKSASYGANCGVGNHNNATSSVQSQCDGHAACGYVVDHKILGDPAPNCAKDFSVDWSCAEPGPMNAAHLAGEAGGQTVTLSCAD